MLRQANKIYIGQSALKAVMRGRDKVYPGLVRTDSGINYSAWSYAGAVRTRTSTPWSEEVYQNGTTGGVIYGAPSVQSENAVSTSYGTWSYNWTITGSSTRTRTTTHAWADGATSAGAAQTETGGTRYVVFDNYGGNIGAGDGSTSYRTVSHDYWGDLVQTVEITGVSVYAGDFSVSVSGSRVTLSRGVNYSEQQIGATLTGTKSGFITRQYEAVYQNANSHTTTTETSAAKLNPHCSGYTYIYNQQVRDRFNWATGHVTYSDWRAGSEIREYNSAKCGYTPPITPEKKRNHLTVSVYGETIFLNSNDNVASDIRCTVTYNNGMQTTMFLSAGTHETTQQISGVTYAQIDYFTPPSDSTYEYYT